MNRKLRIIAACLLAALLLCGLAGCRLALEEGGTNTYEDRLVGVLVTTEYLDLFDMEGYIKDNIGALGGDIAIGENAENYQGRLYATLTKKTLTSEETGETCETEQYVFEGVKGISYFCARIPATAEHESYLATASDEAVSDGHTSVNSADGGTVLCLEGTVYVSCNAPRHTYYFNPAYQSADGRVYVISGSGFLSDEAQAEGTSFSQTMDAKYSATENGKTKTDSISVKLSIHTMNPPNKIVILQMDRDSAVLARMEYAPGKLPKAVALEKGAEYIVVETHKTDSWGRTQVARTLYGKDAETLETFYCREDGICVKQWTQVK